MATRCLVSIFLLMVLEANALARLWTPIRPAPNAPSPGDALADDDEDYEENQALGVRRHDYDSTPRDFKPAPSFAANPAGSAIDRVVENEGPALAEGRKSDSPDAWLSNSSWWLRMSDYAESRGRVLVSSAARAAVREALHVVSVNNTSTGELYMVTRAAVEGAVRAAMGFANDDILAMKSEGRPANSSQMSSSMHEENVVELPNNVDHDRTPAAPLSQPKQRHDKMKKRKPAAPLADGDYVSEDDDEIGGAPVVQKMRMPAAQPPRDSSMLAQLDDVKVSAQNAKLLPASTHPLLQSSASGGLAQEATSQDMLSDANSGGSNNARMPVQLFENPMYGEGKLEDIKSDIENWQQARSSNMITLMPHIKGDVYTVQLSPQATGSFLHVKDAV